MTTIAVKTNPQLWERSKARAVQRLGGKWSARAAQLAVKYYKDAGGKYRGPKTKNNRLSIWTREKWRTRSGKPSGVTGERYLPSRVIEHLSEREYNLSTRKKRQDTRKGRQWSSQPLRIKKRVSQLKRKYRV